MSAPRDNTLADAEQLIADLQRQLAECKAERDAALAREAATAEVLRVINSSPDDPQPVFELIARSAIQLCPSAQRCSVTEHIDGMAHLRAMHGHDAAQVEVLRQQWPRPITRDTVHGRVALTGRAVQFGDVETDEGAEGHLRDLARAFGSRSLLGVPLRRDGQTIGSIVLTASEPNAFGDAEVALLESFAEQAVIAIGSAETLRELRQRTGELTESLEHQTATAEVLKVISRSAFDLQPVLDTLTESAVRLCNATRGHLRLRDGELFPVHAFAGNYSAELLDFLRLNPIKAGRETVTGRAALTGLPQNVADVTTDPDYDPPDFLKRRGNRSFLAVPLLRDGQVEGVLALTRQEVQPLTRRQVELVSTFADQAVIAIENARLFNEVQSRTRDLTEALEQQTATAEVLQVINSSPGNLAPVFEAMLEKALRLCEAAIGFLWIWDGEQMHRLAFRGVPDELMESLRQPYKPPPGSIPARMIGGESVISEADVLAGGGPHRLPTLAHLGARSCVGVALRKEDKLLGGIVIYRREVQPFSDKQSALLQNFAAQAVIAMENARLLTETREALEQQTATAEVLAVINSSPGELASVFDAILDKALGLCGAEVGFMNTYDGQNFQHATDRGVPATYASYRRNRGPTVYGRGTGPARLVAGEDVAHTVDLMSTEPYERGDPTRRALVDLGGARSSLCVALRKDRTLLGMITVYRQEVRPFSDKQIALLQNFAAQAVIAMENARLLGELRARTEEVAELNRGLEARVAEQVEELGRVGRLKRFLAPQLAELIVSQGDEKILESHRREIVVVFCDLRGYTAFTETAEPEEVLDFLREYHGALGPLVSQFEGTLDQFSGDGIMVFFNDPVPIPDPAERAVNMAVAMREAAGTLIADWRERGRDLGFGAGIAQGYATLGQIGFSERSGYTAIGTVCNVAARLCGEAKDGQILLSQRVNVALKGSLATVQVGAVALKGLTQPVVAYNVPLVGSQAALRVIEGGAPSA
jgi:adenylate cyclase